jgi:hypothetical protein
MVGHVDLIDARSDTVVVRELLSKRYNLDEGMAALYGGRVYYGADAVNLISLLVDEGVWLAKFLALLLSNPRRARFLYPIMKFGRRMVLRLLRIPNIPAQ